MSPCISIHVENKGNDHHSVAVCSWLREYKKITKRGGQTLREGFFYQIAFSINIEARTADCQSKYSGSTNKSLRMLNIIFKKIE